MTESETTDRIGIIVSAVKRETVRWLWKGWLAFGKVTVLDGDPGVGKSTVICNLIARHTTEKGFPGTTGPDEPGSALIITVEDGIADTIRPRLEVAGADLDRVTVLQTFRVYDPDTGLYIDHIPSLPDDIQTIEQALWESEVTLLVIDPLMAHLSGAVNSHRDQDVRRALAPLAKMADTLGVAVIVVRHLNKMPGGNPLYRGGGSIGIIGAARLGMLLARDPDDEDSLVLASTKSNLGRLPKSLSIQIVPSADDPDVGIVQWGKESHYAAADLLNQPRTRENPELDRAAEWLLVQLADEEPHRASEMWQRATADDLAEKTIRRALKKLKIVPERLGGLADRGAWYWQLPSSKVATSGTRGSGYDGQGPSKTNEVTTLTRTDSKELFDKNGHDRLSGKQPDLPA